MLSPERYCLRRAVISLLGVWLAVAVASAYAAEQAAPTSSVTSGASQPRAAKKIFSPSSPGRKPAFLHIGERSGEATPLANRQGLEERAGEDAGKLLLRSWPARAQVWVDGRVVGRTPLLLILAPGHYQVVMRGARMDSAHAQVDVPPEETQEIVFFLVSRYPAQVRLR